MAYTWTKSENMGGNIHSSMEQQEKKHGQTGNQKYNINNSLALESYQHEPLCNVIEWIDVVVYFTPANQCQELFIDHGTDVSLRTRQCW